MSEELKALAQTSFCGSLRMDTIQFLRDRAVDVTQEAGGDFFLEGESGDAVYLLLEGSVAIIKSCDGREIELTRLAAGDLFGEMALVAIRCRNATVRALEPSRALKLRHMAILELYEHDAEQFTLLQMNFSREMARRLAAANEALFDARCQGFGSKPD